MISTSNKRVRSEGKDQFSDDPLVTKLESRAMEMLLTRIRNKDLQSRFVFPSILSKDSSSY